MTPERPSLEDLVRAICEGKPIDWDALEQEAPPGFHDKLGALRVVESIARVHRSVLTEDVESPPAPNSGTDAPARWGHLELLEHLASGAFGDVYRAWDSGLDREVALKLLRRSLDADAHADEALEEGRLLARIHHPNVVTVYGAARFDGRAGIWMEFVRGRTLADLVGQKGPLAPDHVAAIGVALCDALSAVHGASLIHRDIKAQNAMLADDGRIVLMDFGAGGSVRHAGLQQGGTPRYLAPEVAAGGPATIQSDIYSLGVTLRCLLTGSFAESPDRASTNGAGRRLLSVLTRATRAQANERFESARTFAGALATLTEPRRNVVAIAAAATLVAALLSAVGMTLRLRNREESHRREFEVSWQTAIPARAALTPDQVEGFNGTIDRTFSLHGIIAGTSGDSIVTFDPKSGHIRVWLTPSGEGHFESPMVSPDNSLMVYVWNDHACRCASLRTVDRAGRVRTLLANPDIVTIGIGATSSRILPIVTSDESMRFELAVVDIDSGATHVLRRLPIDPDGFSLSPDGRFVAFDSPTRLDPGAPHSIIILDTRTSREWPLLNATGDLALPVWSPQNDAIVYLESSKGTTLLKGVKVSDGHQTSAPALLRHDLGRPAGIGFIDERTFAYWVMTGRSDVLVVDAAPNGRFHGQNARRVGHGSMMPVWSPNGHWLAWSDFAPRSGGIRVTDGEGRVYRTFRPSLDVQVYPAWSEDSSQLAFWDVSRMGGILKVADLEKATAREVWRWSHPQIEGAWDVAWMPGGRDLRVQMGSGRPATLDTISGNLRDIRKQAPELGIVSPDRHWRAYCDTAPPYAIHVVPAEAGGEPLTLPVSSFPSQRLLGWWPDGSLLEIRGDASGELWRRPLKGPAQPLGIIGTNINSASVAPDAKRVAYVTQTYGQELWTLTPVGPQ